MPTILKLNYIYIYSMLYIYISYIKKHYFTYNYIYRYYRRKFRSKLPTIWTDEKQRMTWHHFFVAGAALSTDEVEKPQKRIGTRPSALHSIFHYWRKSRRIASFLMLPASKIEALFLTLSSSKVKEVSQDCFVFHVVTFENGGSLAE